MRRGRGDAGMGEIDEGEKGGGRKERVLREERELRE